MILPTKMMKIVHEYNSGMPLHMVANNNDVPVHEIINALYKVAVEDKR